MLYTLTLATPLASRGNNLPILNNILIEAQDAKVTITATNLEAAVRAQLRAKVEIPGSFTVPARTLTDFIQLLSGDHVDVSLSNGEFSIISGSTRTKLRGVSAEEYPVIPPPAEVEGYGILVEPFRDALTKTAIAVAKNEIRPELSGVYFGFFTERHAGLVLAATDSYRLAEKKISVSQGGETVSCIVPARAVSEIIRLLSVSRSEEGESQVRMLVSQNQIVLRYDSFEFTSRLVDGNYPDYAQIIPQSFRTTATFPKDRMVNHIKAASLFTAPGVNAVSFDLNVGAGTIAVSSTSSQTGEHSSEIDGGVSGEENSILLNYRYVLEGLQQMDAEEVDFRVNSGDAPCLFQPKQYGDYLYIVMPIRQ